jgi:hypothetical protein
MIIGKPIKKIIGMESFEDKECFGIIWKHKGQAIDIEGMVGVDGRFEVIGLVVTPMLEKKGKAKKKSA